MPFEYHEPESLADAIDLLSEYGDDSLPLAGGTAFSVLNKRGLLAQSHVVGLRRLSDLRGIRLTDDELFLGAMTTHRQVEQADIVVREQPTLAAAYRAVATVRVRNQATVGGGLGFGDPAQDPPTALVALDAVVDITGPSGHRAVTSSEFFVDYFTTALKPGELVVGVRVPRVTGVKSTYLKFLPRSLDDYGTVATAVAIRSDSDGRIDHARVVMGGVGPQPMRIRVLEDQLIGTILSDLDLRDTVSSVGEAVDPIDDLRGSADYKRRMSQVFVERALASLGAPR